MGSALVDLGPTRCCGDGDHQTIKAFTPAGTEMVEIGALPARARRADVRRGAAEHRADSKQCLRGGSA